MGARVLDPVWVPLGDGTHKLAIKADVRDVIHKAEGDTVDIHLTERLG